MQSKTLMMNVLQSLKADCHLRKNNKFNYFFISGQYQQIIFDPELLHA